MGGMSSLPYSPPTRAKGMWKALSRLKEFSLTATPLRSPSTSKFQENPELQSQHGTFELLPYCKAKLHFFSSRGIHNKKPTAKKKMLTVQQIAYGGNYPLKPCQRIGCKHFDQQFWRQQQSALRSHIGYKLK